MRSLLKSSFAFFTLLSAGLFGNSEHAIALGTTQYRTIALTDTDGSLGPGIGANYQFSGLSRVALSEAGEVSFLGQTESTLFLDEGEGYWLNAGISNDAIAQTNETGALGPGLGGDLVFDNHVDLPNISDSGNVVVSGFINGTGVDSTNNYTLALHENGANTAFARQGVDSSLGPDLGSNVVFELFFVGSSINSDDVVLFQGQLTGPGIDGTNNLGIWRNNSSGNSVIALTGVTDSRGPGLGTDTVFVPFFNLAQIRNGSEDIVFSARVFDFSSSSEDIGLWENDGIQNTAIALSSRTDSLGPGLGNVVTFADTSSQLFLPINSSDGGNVAFFSELSNGSEGLWRNSGAGNNSLALTNQTGLLGPGLGPTDTFAELGPSDVQADLKVNENDAVVFSGIVSGSHHHGLWLNSGSGNEILALAGDEGALGPDMGPGFHFTSFNQLAINDNDTVFFTANLNVNIRAHNNLGLWAYFGNQIVKIAAYGEQFDVDPTAGVDLRTITAVSMPEIDATNNADEVVFRLAFDDGSLGIFTASLVIPEPATVPLLMTLLLSGCRLRGRRLPIECF